MTGVSFEKKCGRVDLIVVCDGYARRQVFWQKSDLLKWNPFDLKSGNLRYSLQIKCNFTEPSGQS